MYLCMCLSGGIVGVCGGKLDKSVCGGIQDVCGVCGGDLNKCVLHGAVQEVPWVHVTVLLKVHGLHRPWK